VTFGFRERVRAAASAVLPSPIKRSLKRLVRGYHRRFRAFTPVDLNRALVELGVVAGDVVMVHSAFDSFLGFQGGPVDVIRTLREVVGARGPGLRRAADGVEDGAPHRSVPPVSGSGSQHPPHALGCRVGE